MHSRGVDWYSTCSSSASCGFKMDIPVSTTREDELREPVAQGPSQRPDKEQGRQGQNIRGMVTVLFVSIALAAVGFAVVFYLSPREEAAEAAAPPS